MAFGPVGQKTNGNPFFVTELLKKLHQEEVFQFSYDHGFWEWELDQIHEMNVSDNVVELMIGRIEELSPVTQDALKMGACIGSRFDLATLALARLMLT